MKALTFLATFFLMLFLSFISHASEEYERELYRIYTEKYPLLSDREWSALLGQSQLKEKYVVQKNDNLWDISRVFFGTGFYWPKIWSFNGQIRNPHEILPGQVLVFSFGTLSESPSVELLAQESDKPDTASSAEDLPQQPILQNDTKEKKEEVMFENKVSDKIQDIIPPPRFISKPTLKELPLSLPYLFYGINTRPEEEEGFDLKGYYGEVSKKQRTVLLSHYILNHKSDGLGKLVEISSGRSVVHEGDEVILRLSNNTEHEKGEELLVVSNNGALIRVNSYVPSVRPYIMEIVGQVKILEKLSESGFYNIYRAHAFYIRGAMEKGNLLFQGELETIQVSSSLEEEVFSSQKAQIIGGAPLLNKQLHDEASLVYLNKGNDDGLKKGDVLRIVENKKMRKTESRYVTKPRVLGALRVVHIDDRFSTAVVLRAKEHIFSGDFTQ